MLSTNDRFSSLIVRTCGGSCFCIIFMRSARFSSAAARRAASSMRFFSSASHSVNVSLYSAGNKRCKGKEFATFARATTATRCSASTFVFSAVFQKKTLSLSGLCLSRSTNLHVQPAPSGSSCALNTGDLKSVFFCTNSCKMTFGNLHDILENGVGALGPAAPAAATASLFACSRCSMMSAALEDTFLSSAAPCSATTSACCLAMCCFKRSCCLNILSQ
mmetsp:Transcript_1440/g.5254  ORF Transcript_1440/g.5254 Transcript_1440/m.5254 type:complete len:219 (-) Transcript_1440:200-856(-)